MRLSCLLLIILVCAVVAAAQEPWPQEREDQRQRAVLNEDGGQSYLVLPATRPLVGLLKPGASNLGDLEQRSIFLGAGWSDPSLRARRNRLGKLLSSIRDGAQRDDVSASGINNFFAPAWTVDRQDIAGNRDISDLEIQGILNQELKDGPEPSAESIYVIYLDPTIHSKLGALIAGKHYIAYHGFFNSSGTKIHYAVVPFESDAEAAYQIALRTFIVAALHSAEATR
jgi:hypothetical protein